MCVHHVPGQRLEHSLELVQPLVKWQRAHVLIVEQQNVEDDKAWRELMTRGPTRGNACTVRPV